LHPAAGAVELTDQLPVKERSANAATGNTNNNAVTIKLNQHALNLFLISSFPPIINWNV
jgi:hypothetical protein